jgi:hypothetical protein
VVVGCFDFAGNFGSPGYYSFYTTALKFLERDPYREVGFAVVTSMKMCSHMGFDWSPALRIYMWNETLVCIVCYFKTSYTHSAIDIVDKCYSSLMKEKAACYDQQVTVNR